jgi:hypothetical protein
VFLTLVHEHGLESGVKLLAAHELAHLGLPRQRAEESVSGETEREREEQESITVICLISGSLMFLHRSAGLTCTHTNVLLMCC